MISTKRTIVNRDVTFFENIPYHQQLSFQREKMSEESSVGKYLDLSDLSFNSNEFSTTNNEPTSLFVLPNGWDLNQDRYRKTKQKIDNYLFTTV